jgi:class 3 adenylate cyclase
VPANNGAGIDTFLIADVRGYTRFTREHGDERAAALTASFATLVREVVNAHDGDVIELRGDEALAAFVSARQALRAAVDLQIRFAERADEASGFPLGLGVGLDAGEAVPLEGGYRGGALNIASRLCAAAGPGQILATETVASLASRLEGVRVLPARPLRLKGFDRPLRVHEVMRELDATERVDLGLFKQRRARLTLAGAVLAAAIIAAVLLLRKEDEEGGPATQAASGGLASAEINDPPSIVLGRSIGP